MRARRRGAGGFAHITVMLGEAVGALVAAHMLDMVSLDLVLAGSERRVDEARELAEGSIMEVIEDVDTPTALPVLDDGDLRASWSPSTASPFASSSARRTSVELRLVRVVPLAESSLQQTRAVVHEVRAVGAVNEDEARHEIRTEVYRVVAFRPGMVIPRRHGR